VPSVRRAKRVTAAVRAVGLPSPSRYIRAVVFPLVRVAYLLETRLKYGSHVLDRRRQRRFAVWNKPPALVRVALSLPPSLFPSFSLDLSGACPSACFSSFGRYCAFEDASLRVSYLSSWRKLRQTAYFFGDYSRSCSHGEYKIEDLIVSISFDWFRWIVCRLSGNPYCLWFLYVISYVSSC